MCKKSLAIFISTMVIIGTILCANTVAADLPFTIKNGLFDQTKTDNLGLSAAKGAETVNVFRPSDSTNKYSNGVVMTGFNGWLYCQWQSSVKDEDTQDTWVAYSRSMDGKNWSIPMKLPTLTDDKYCTSGGWWVSGDTLVAYVNVWSDNATPRAGNAYYTTSTDGLTWTPLKQLKMADGSAMDGVIEQDPHALPSGRIIDAAQFQPGLIASPIYTDDSSGIKGWVRASYTNMSVTSVSSREIEPSWFWRSDGTDVMVFRDQNSTYHTLASVSVDSGKSWTTPVVTDMPDSRSKQCAGNLPDGTAFMVNNPVESKTRIPLVISISKDGKVFDKAYVLRQGGSNLQEQRYTGRSKTLGYSYPKATIWQGYLYVSYSVNKEDVEFTRVPLTSLSLNSTTTPTIPDGRYIKSLVANDKENAADWSIQSNLQVGDLTYGDRIVKFATIPEKLLGAEWIRTACDSKAYTSEAASFTAKSDISVYVGLDSRVTTIPNWLSSWTKTGEALSGDNAVTFNLYKKDFSLGSVIGFGENGQSTSAVNYTVIVKPYTAPTFTYGDANEDGEINALDFACIKKYLLTGETDTMNLSAADVNADSSVNAIDLALMKSYLLGIITNF